MNTKKKERLRKQKSRVKMREKEIGEKRASTNKILGKKRRRNSDEKNVGMIKEINLKLNMFRRENNRLRMSLKRKEK